MTKNAKYQPNLTVPGPKFLVPSYRGTNKILFLCWKNWIRTAKAKKKCNFDPKIWYLGPKINYLFWNHSFLSGRHYNWGYNFSIGPTPEKSCVRGTGPFLWLNPTLSHFWGVARHKSNYPQLTPDLNFPKKWRLKIFWLYPHFGQKSEFLPR